MKTIFTATLAAALILGGFGFYQYASAQNAESPARYGNGYSHMIEEKAGFVNMEPEELKTQLQEKHFGEIVEQQGKTIEEWQAQHQEQVQNRWSEMGLSDEEIQSRLQLMEQRHQEGCDGEPKGPLSGESRGFGQGHGMMQHAGR